MKYAWELSSTITDISAIEMSFKIPCHILYSGHRHADKLMYTIRHLPYSVHYHFKIRLIHWICIIHPASIYSRPISSAAGTLLKFHSPILSTMKKGGGGGVQGEWQRRGCAREGVRWNLFQDSSVYSCYYVCRTLPVMLEQRSPAAMPEREQRVEQKVTGLENYFTDIQCSWTLKHWLKHTQNFLI